MFFTAAEFPAAMVLFRPLMVPFRAVDIVMIVLRDDQSPMATPAIAAPPMTASQAPVSIARPPVVFPAGRLPGGRIRKRRRNRGRNVRGNLTQRGRMHATLQTKQPFLTFRDHERFGSLAGCVSSLCR